MISVHEIYHTPIQKNYINFALRYNSFPCAYILYDQWSGQWQSWHILYWHQVVVDSRFRSQMDSKRTARRGTSGRKRMGSNWLSAMSLPISILFSIKKYPNRKFVHGSALQSLAFGLHDSKYRTGKEF